MKKVYTFLADGFEEVEALAVVDILLRAGIDVKTVSIGDSEDLMVRGAHDIYIKADMLFDLSVILNGDMIFLPGGLPGAANLYQHKELCSAILKYNEEGKMLAAICAAPGVFGKLGILKGKKATCFPGFEDELIGAQLITQRVVRDGNIITSRGLGASIDLGLEIVNVFISEEASLELGKKIQYID